MSPPGIPTTSSFANTAVIFLALDLDTMKPIIRVIATIFQPGNNRSGSEAAPKAVGKCRVFDLLAETVQLLLQFLFFTLTPFELDQPTVGQSG